MSYPFTNLRNYMNISIPIMRRAALALLGLSSLFFHASSEAHGNDGAPDDGYNWGVGLVGIYKVKPYRDFDNKAEALPFITYENRWVRVFGPGMDVKLGNTGDVSYAMSLQFANDGYQSDDSPYLAGMKERKFALWLGGRVNWKNEIANVSAAWQGDASGNSQGQRFVLAAEHRFGFGNLGLTPRLSATWLDSKYVDYYYGVNADEVLASRSAYNGASTVNTELGVRIDYRLAPQHRLILNAGATMLGGSIKDSPLVDRNTSSEVSLGYIYRF